MIRIGILGNIGSGKSYVAKSFKYPVFNADLEVSKLYKNNKKIFLKLNKRITRIIKNVGKEWKTLKKYRHKQKKKR